MYRHLNNVKLGKILEQSLQFAENPEKSGKDISKKPFYSN
jgi:hypothetical protein